MNDFQIGVGLRQPHYSHLLKKPKTPVRWFEAISENFMNTEGRPLSILQEIRSDFPIALHGVSMSIGGPGDVPEGYLKKLTQLVKRIDPFIVSDHLCWTGTPHGNLHDLLPVPFTEESLQHICRKMDLVQSALQRPMLLENVSSYLTYKDSTQTEWEFLSAVAKKSGCKLLLDINNVYVSATNHQFDPLTFIDGISPDLVGQIHLAGFTDMGDFLFDTHSAPVYPKVWELFSHAIQKLPEVPVLIEWDEEIPEFSALEAEAMKAQKIWSRWHG